MSITSSSHRRHALALGVCLSLTSTPALPAAETPGVEPYSANPYAANPYATTTADHELGHYAANLGRNLKGIFGRGNVRPLLIGAELALSGSLLDRRAENYFDQHPHPAAGRTGARLGGTLVVAGLTAGLFSAGALSHEGRFHDTTYDLSQAVLVNITYTYALKNTIHRMRPDGSNALSFPSGHTSTAFAAATVLQSHYGKKVGIPAYGIASLIGASRMASKAHHLSDVVAGAGLGYLVGRTVVGHDDRAGRHRQLALGTMASPSGDGVGLALNFGF